LVNSIWINYNDSLTWIKAIKGDDFPCKNHDSRLRSQWAIEAHWVDKLTGGQHLANPNSILYILHRLNTFKRLV
jgi:hypothetical protein